MPGNQNFGRGRQGFAAQFEADGSSFLYRKNMKGAPIRVSEGERDAFVNSFNRRFRYAFWSVLSLITLLIAVVVILVPNSNRALGQLVVTIGAACIILPYTVAMRWAWNAPARELERRAPAGPARSDEEFRRIKLSKMTYGQLGLAAFVVCAGLLRVSMRVDGLHGWGIVFTAFTAVLVLILAVQAVQKWRLDRS